jgi:hypothetical protein
VHDQSFFVSAAPLQYDRLSALVAHLPRSAHGRGRGREGAGDLVGTELLTVGLCTPHYLGLFPNYIEGLWARGEHRSRPRATHRRHFPAGRLGAAQIKYGLCGN